jgi:glycine oxidase
VRPGEASPAAAGLLSPSVNAPADAQAALLGRLARDEYPAYVAMLEGRSGVHIPLNRLGALELALTDEAAEALQLVLPDGSRWLDADLLAEHEPALAHAAGAALHPHDGAVNNLVLLRALKAVLGRHERVQVLADAAESIVARPGDVAIETRGGSRIVARRVVIAAGAWAPQLGGLPRALPIVPLRGHMLSVAGSPIRHVTFGAGGYLVPRGDGRTYVGSTDDGVGFDATTTDAGIAEVRRIGAAIAAPIAAARMLNGWAGLRPMSPDGQPIVGADPDHPAILYACGHSRNGVLLAPLTGEAIGALAADAVPAHDLRPWAVTRFG